MPKQPFFESAIHHLLLQAKTIANSERVQDPHNFQLLKAWILTWRFTSIDHQSIRVDWTIPQADHFIFSIKSARYYTRGDLKTQNPLKQAEDSIYKKNSLLFQSIVKQLAKHAKITLHSRKSSAHAKIKAHEEEELSDVWAEHTDPDQIDIIQTNTAITSPELRFIHRSLGDIQGKKVLDVGSGLGEVSIYFALRGAKVTALDLSLPMLTITQQLAKRYKVEVETIHASIEALRFKHSQQFDVIYVGNLFHHVNIPQALATLLPHLKPSGTLALWEPVAYNPIINIYRKIANQVRSTDERPFTFEDISTFRKSFQSVTTRWYWLSTLLIFIIMYITGRNPNRERYWKVIIQEADQWRWLYRPLSRFDTHVLKAFPFLRRYCWNVVMICQNKIV